MTNEARINEWLRIEADPTYSTEMRRTAMRAVRYLRSSPIITERRTIEQMIADSIPTTPGFGTSAGSAGHRFWNERADDVKHGIN